MLLMKLIVTSSYVLYHPVLQIRKYMRLDVWDQTPNSGRCKHLVLTRYTLQKETQQQEAESRERQR